MPPGAVTEGIMSTQLILLLCLSFGASLRVYQFGSMLAWLLRAEKGRIPEILMKPDADAVMRRVRRGVRTRLGMRGHAGLQPTAFSLA
jgi:hypothetical protein